MRKIEVLQKTNAFEEMQAYLEEIKNLQNSIADSVDAPVQLHAIKFILSTLSQASKAVRRYGKYVGLED